jgi:hypothetical protein
MPEEVNDLRVQASDIFLRPSLQLVQKRFRNANPDMNGIFHHHSAKNIKCLGVPCNMAASGLLVKNTGEQIVPNPQDTETHMRIRVPDSLRDALIDIAEQNGRSLNTEVVTRLQSSLAQRNDFARLKDDVAALLFRVKALDDALARIAVLEARVLGSGLALGDKQSEPANLTPLGSKPGRKK